MTGCAGMTLAGVWTAVCAGVSAGAAVWQAEKVSASEDEKKEVDPASGNTEKTAIETAVEQSAESAQETK